MVNGILRRRRVFRLVSFLTVAGLIFVCFQIFSAELLNKSDHDATKMKLIAKEIEKPDIHYPSSHNLPADCISNPLLCQKPLNQSNAVIQKGNKLFANNDLDMLRNHVLFENMHAKRDNFKLDEDVVRKDEDSYENEDRFKDGDYAYEHNENAEVGLHDVIGNEEYLPRGVPAMLGRHYVPDKDNMFTCLKTQEKISFSLMNDDYCDCSDSSDEPGTNACPQSRFYCEFQVTMTTDPKWISGSKVNDGVCDCCDGSDEWNNMVLPERMLLHDKRLHYGVDQGPCANRCSQLQAALNQLSAAHKKGAQLKQRYLSNLAGTRHMNKLYGVDGAYYMLADECFSRSSDKYQYIVCVFRHITQANGPDKKIIGRNGSWLDARRLQMIGGDSAQCPGMRRRQTVIEFDCSTENQIQSVQETEVCEYTIKFSTPAAC